MELIITAQVKKSEYEPLQKWVSFEILKKAGRKSIEGLGDTIKSSKKIPGTLLKKIYITTPGGAARSIFLLRVGAEKCVLVMLRLKNDKKIGANMTVDNPKFRKVLDKNLDGILSDLAAGRYEVVGV